LSPPLVHVSGLIPPHQREQIEALAGDRGISAGVRDVIAAGLLALQSDMALLQPIADLEALVNKLSYIQGRKTPSGAWWAPTDAALPPIEQMDPLGDVIAQPMIVALTTEASVLIIDAEAGVLTIRENGAEKAMEAEFSDLMGPICRLSAVAAHLAHHGPGRVELGTGLWLRLLPVGAVRIEVDGLGVTCKFATLLQFASELISLSARAAGRSLEARLQLERQMGSTVERAEP
jgi:hypothetical protein